MADNLKHLRRKDVLDELRDAIRNGMRPGTHDSDVNVYELPCTVTYGLLRRLELEIEKLRKEHAA